MLSADERAALRIDLLKLVHRHDQTTAAIITRAKELEAYVIAGHADKALAKRG